MTSSPRRTYVDPTVNLPFAVSDGLAFYLTPCCGATGKGSSNSPTGVCCRACYHPVATPYGGSPSTATLRAACPQETEAIEAAEGFDKWWAGRVTA